MERKLSVKAIIITAAIIVVAAGAVTSSYMIKGWKNTSLTNLNANPDEWVAALEKLSDEGKFEEVEKTAEQILKTKPNEDIILGALWELTLAESRLGKFEEAIAHAKKMNDYEPSSSHFLLGLVYFDKKDYVKAKEELTQAKQLQPSMSEQVDAYIQWMKENAGV